MIRASSPFEIIVAIIDAAGPVEERFCAIAHSDKLNSTFSHTDRSGNGHFCGNASVPKASSDVSSLSENNLNLRLAFYSRTDLGNAERFRERYRGKLLWCRTRGWLWWDGKRWARDGAFEKVKTAEHNTVRAIQDEADTLRNSKRDFVIVSHEGRVMMSAALASWGRASEQMSRLARIANLAKPYLLPEQPA
jgi:putative DNA primase/helicase